MNRQTARKQADRTRDRKFEHVVRHGAGRALADIKHVGDHENREDGSLSGNQGKHSHASARGKKPLRFNGRSRKCCATQSSSPVYSYFQSGSSGCLMSQSGRRLLTTGIVAKLYSGGGELVDHSSVHASQGSFPAASPLTSDLSKLNPNTSTPAI